MNPHQVDLRPDVDFVEDQNAYGACTGYGYVKNMDVQFERVGRDVRLSPECLWSIEKTMAHVIGNVGVDEHIGVMALTQYGTCLQSTWPDGSPIDMVATPYILAEAAQFKISGSEFQLGSPSTLTWLKTQLAKGKPVCIKVRWLNDDYALSGPWRTHTINTVESDANPFVAYHWALCIGYDDAVKRLLGQNSFGPLWADGGFFGCDYDAFNAFTFVVDMCTIQIPGIPAINAGWRPDMTAAQTQVQQAYLAYFGRPADAAGLDYWAGTLSILGLAAVLDWFASSDESHALYPSASPTDIIIAAYLNLFNRAPDAAGLAFWTHAIDTGALTLGGVIYAVLSGALGADAAIVAAKVEAADVMTHQAEYTSADVPAARAWLAAITSADQVQPAVQAMPLEGFPP